MHPPRSTSHPWRGHHLLLPPLMLLFSLCSADPLLHRCYNGIKYTDSSAFHQSLMQVIRSLTATLPAGGYIDATAGEAPDRVYAVALCRGDVSANDCQSCLGNGTADMVQFCPQSTDASVWYDHCYIRYSGDYLLGDPFGKVYVSCGKDGESNPSLFGKQLTSLMKNLTTGAATDPSTNMFETGEIDVTDSKKIYGMVQCRRDLSGNDCLACLQSLVYFSANQCSSTNSARVWHDSCNARYDIQPFLQISDTQPASSSQPVQRKAVSGKVKIIVIAISAAVLVAAVGFGLCACAVKKRRAGTQERPGLGDSLHFDVDAIRAATNSFSDANRIGEGGHGPMYMGKLANGRVVAVERLSMDSGQEILEFKNEVELTANLRHKNLVQLLGYCADRHQRLLIYEFVPNTSLDKFIFDPDRAIVLDWPTRLKIIGGIARGILYLHEDAPHQIIHKNIKASNILLDENMNPKIADFGISCSRNSWADSSQAATSSIARTLGYIAPECLSEDQISVKSDVYSFGILLLEIVSGRPNIPYQLAPSGYNLLMHAWTLWRDRQAVELVDPILCRTCETTEVQRCIQIALLCAQDNPTNRPTMSSIVYMLSGGSQMLPSPSPSMFLSSGEPDNSVILGPSDAARAIREAYYIGR